MNKRVKIERLELDGHVAVSISEKEVRVWVCSSKTGANIFRLKAIGKVYRAGQDIMVYTESEKCLSKRD